MKKKLDQAEKTLMRIRDSQDVSEELQDIVISLEEEEKTKGKSLSLATSLP